MLVIPWRFHGITSYLTLADANAKSCNKIKIYKSAIESVSILILQTKKQGKMTCFFA